MIQNVLDKNVKYTDKKDTDTNCPDASFELTGIENFQHAGLVVEVGWTQKSSELKQKCQGYIKKSKGLVRTVVGIDLHDLYECYQAVIDRVGKVAAGEDKAIRLKRIQEMATETLKREATGKISLWHSQWDEVTRTAKARVAFSDHKFREKDEKPVGGVALCFSLQAFISERIEAKFLSSHNPRCAISAEYLCSRLDAGLKEMFTYIPKGSGGKNLAVGQIDWDIGFLPPFVQDEGEPFGPPSFLPGPSTPQVRPTEDNSAEDELTHGPWVGRLRKIGHRLNSLRRPNTS
ncbi:hypothetical protein NUW58_g7685 [Xylaria curta]|uniref:Uncharacterized protein n=1 Tax=Xylaria curta TaxID=42375 RepID=A0ACC1NFM6_9PEZI|nr:hypothetical protein NUW58_g7685 [Xylaria curta]